MKKLSFLIIITFILLTQKSLYAQQGTFSIGFSLGLITKGGLSFGYSITDKILIEFHYIAEPRMSANGIALRIYPITDNYNSYFIWGYSFFGSSLSYFNKDTLGLEITNKTESFEGFNFGIGNEFNLNKSNLKMPIELGINYVVDAKSSTNIWKEKNTETENELISEYKTIKKTPELLDKDWSGFVLIGVNSYFKLKSEKVNR